MTPFGGAALFALALLLAVLGFLLITTYNAVVALQNRIDKAWANIEVVLQQRHDLLPNLVDAVRGAMAFERDVLEEVARRRAAWSPTDSIPQQAETSEATSSAVRQLFAVVERYPELRSTENVLDLQDELERLESMIADRRELYNDQVFRYDTRIQQVPASFLAPVFGWTRRPFFDAEDGATIAPEVSLTDR
jgi:LemA protein